MIKSFLTKTIALLVLALLIGAIGFLIIYPKQSEIKVLASELDTQKITHNTTLKILMRISQPIDEATLLKLNSDISMENITPEQMAKYQNDGHIITKLEPLETGLTIQSANISGKVFDGEDSNTLLSGIWHFPLSTAPGDRGNAVFIAHRYQKVPPELDTFFNLDKVKVGDKIIISQNVGNLTYTVTETKIVERDDRTVLMPTNDYRITLMTCTPLWTDEQRLIVIAKLDKVYQKT